ncbi:MAG: LamG domain-containing protein [Akkermansia sp.]|nr:LamG domain-containing protein [Akkermansia sp.]
MKKTLLTLLATCGVATGTELTTIATWEQILSQVTFPGGGVTLNKSYDGKVYTFDGTHALTGGTNDALNTALSSTSSTYVTIAAWAKVDAVAVNNTIFGYGESGKGFKMGLGADEPGGGVSIPAAFATTKDVEQILATTTDQTKWTMVAITLSVNAGAVNGFKVFTGENVSESTSTMNIPTTKTFSIGSQYGNGENEVFKGDIGNVMIFTSAAYATGAEITAALGAAPTEVPEPATATLSLLALAGLAVRRRRKQA